jgi:hypothetical protein
LRYKINSIKRSQVRIGHEEVLIAQVKNADKISEKYHFNFNHKWVINNSDTKKIAIRKKQSFYIESNC